MMKRPISLSIIIYGLIIISLGIIIFQGYSVIKVAQIFKEGDDLSINLYRFLNPIIYPVMLIIASIGALKGAYWSKIVIWVWLIPKLINSFLSIVFIEFELASVIQFILILGLSILFFYVFSRSDVKAFFQEKLKNSLELQK